MAKNGKSTKEKEVNNWTESVVVDGTDEEASSKLLGVLCFFFNITAFFA